MDYAGYVIGKNSENTERVVQYALIYQKPGCI